MEFETRLGGLSIHHGDPKILEIFAKKSIWRDEKSFLEIVNLWRYMLVLSWSSI